MKNKPGAMIPVVFILFLYGQSLSVRGEEPPKEEGEEPPGNECGGAFHLAELMSYNLTSPFYGAEKPKPYPGGLNCKWDFMGGKECIAEISCSVLDIRPGEGTSCEGGEYLKVNDGTGGLQKFCGTDTASFSKPIRASKNLRDLYVQFKSSGDGGSRKGFRCEVKCSTNLKGSRELKITQQRAENPQCVCGLKKKAPKAKESRRKKRVVKGEEAEMNEFPWQVAIVKPGTRSSFCGGAIINDQYILTAAHCFWFSHLTEKNVEVLVHAKYLWRTAKKDLRDRTPPKQTLALAEAAEKLKKLLGTKGVPLPGSISKLPAAPKVPNAPKAPKAPKVPETGGVGGLRFRRQLEGLPLDAKSAGSATNATKDFNDVLDTKGGKKQTWNYTDEDENTQRFKVLELTNHPLFTDEYDFDAAVLKLDRKIDLTLMTPESPSSLCLPDFPAYTTTWEKEIPFVVGWGLTKEDANFTTGVLDKLDVPIIPLPKCSNWTGYQLSGRMMCAGHEQGVRDACTGDSGGPLVLVKGKKQHQQIGIVSWGFGCARKQRPGIYARVTELQQWILSQTMMKGVWCKETLGSNDGDGAGIGPLDPIGLGS